MTILNQVKFVHPEDSNAVTLAFLCPNHTDLALGGKYDIYKPEMLLSSPPTLGEIEKESPGTTGPEDRIACGWCEDVSVGIESHTVNFLIL